MATKLEGGGGKALVARPLKNELLFVLRLPYGQHINLPPVRHCSTIHLFHLVLSLFFFPLAVGVIVHLKTK